MSVNELASNSPRVCFVHGLEGTPHGAKVVGMREQGLHVMAPDMHMSAWNMRRKNSAIRSILRLPEVRAMGLAGLASGLLARRHGVWPVIGWGALAFGWAAQRKTSLSRRGLGRSFEVCLEIVARDLATHQPDVIVGSSWGGAVCMELIRLGLITSPTILLAPAYRKVGERLGWADLDEREALIRMRMESVPVQIFHDPGDDVIPFEHSAALVEGTTIRLYGLNAGGHSLLGLIQDGSLVRAVHEMYARR